METIVHLIQQRWEWYIAGPMLSFIMFLLLYFGKSFGLSANLRTMCAIGGGGKYSDFFHFEWKGQIWNLIFALGATVGGWIAYQYLGTNHGVEVSPTITAELEGYGFNVGNEFVPSKLFALDSIGSIFFLIIGGFLVGFGARYAGGCTSGHAISGLSDLQFPSLIAVIGFFIGGLIMTYFILPFLF